MLDNQQFDAKDVLRMHPVLRRLPLERIRRHPVLRSVRAVFPLLLFLGLPQLREDIAEHDHDAVENHGLHELLLEPVQEEGHQGRVRRPGGGRFGKISRVRPIDRSRGRSSISFAILVGPIQPPIVLLGQPCKRGGVLQRKRFDVHGLLAQVVAFLANGSQDRTPGFLHRSSRSVFRGAGATWQGQGFLDGFHVHPDAFQRGGDEPLHSIQFHSVLFEEGFPAFLVPFLCRFVIHLVFCGMDFEPFLSIQFFLLLLPFHLLFHRFVPHVVGS
mmetsp:Transcript_1763/g.10864  ORF Transcript_1763/g.10864 Transcript_1763/m.10864 type:complete len:272 (+) Transcript_1763:2217-3032(+)